jgi:DNA ligase (NAD+)
MKAIKIEEPTVCPFCGAPIVRLLEDGAHLYCSNPDCEERRIAKLNYFVTKECMNIDGLSEKTLRKIVPALNIRNWWDLYNLTAEQLQHAGCGPVVARNIVDELMNSRNKAKAENVLMSLGIAGIGKVNAKKLLERFGSIEEIEKASLDDVVGVLGEVAGNNVHNYMASEKEELQNVYKYFNTKFDKPMTSGNKLFGMTILATGTLKNFSRDEIKESVIANGGTYASGISRGLTFLIVGDKAGAAKIKKANELGISKFTEDEYLNMIK